MLSRHFFLTIVACALGIPSAPTQAAGECPIPFTVHGSAIDEPWADIDYEQWTKAIPKRWREGGEHFFERIKERAPDRNINTPRQLASDMRRPIADISTPKDEDPNRRTIVLNRTNKRGNHFAVVYSYDSTLANAPCILVTATYVTPPQPEAGSE
ncbi:hypothetical protein [Burkholderia stagnalis]|uniref:hypothetical protein n=1 Tax=Burkholderia stagnalis TaxID=1503054 RepID=UPI000AE8F9B0|nr:hypothetical protein [Burkholderia stagnalis]